VNCILVGKVKFPKKQIQKKAEDLFLENTLLRPENRLEKWWKLFWGTHFWSEFWQNLGFRFRYSFICQYLDQERAKWPFRFSCQAATCYYQSTQR